jgi:copper chaperone CopZ
MWPFTQKNVEQPGELVTIKINGMHCASCALTIDEELEELAGVYEARANYAKGEVRVRFATDKVQLAQLHQTIEQLGYIVV